MTSIPKYIDEDYNKSSEVFVECQRCWERHSLDGGLEKVPSLGDLFFPCCRHPVRDTNVKNKFVTNCPSCQSHIRTDNWKGFIGRIAFSKPVVHEHTIKCPSCDISIELVTEELLSHPKHYKIGHDYKLLQWTWRYDK